MFEVRCGATIGRNTGVAFRVLAAARAQCSCRTRMSCSKAAVWSAMPYDSAGAVAVAAMFST